MNVVLCVLFAMETSTHSLASHDDFIETELSDDVYVESKSYKRNWYIWKSIGGESKVYGTKTVRKWWCAWLCRRPVSKNAVLISILNTYYAEVTPGNYRPILERFKECSNTSSCLQREYAIGAAIKFPFPGAGGIENILPVSGIVTEHAINVEGFALVRIVTSKGNHVGPLID